MYFLFKCFFHEKDKFALFSRGSFPSKWNSARKKLKLLDLISFNYTQSLIIFWISSFDTFPFQFSQQKVLESDRSWKRRQINGTNLWDDLIHTNSSIDHIHNFDWTHSARDSFIRSIWQHNITYSAEYSKSRSCNCNNCIHYSANRWRPLIRREYCARCARNLNITRETKQRARSFIKNIFRSPFHARWLRKWISASRIPIT